MPFSSRRVKTPATTGRSTGSGVSFSTSEAKVTAECKFSEPETISS